MALEVKQETRVTPLLVEAFARLMPQLSPALGAPAAERLQRVASGPATALFVAWDGDRVAGVLTLAWYDAPSGRKAWVEDVVVDAAMRGCGAGECLVQAAVGHAAAIGADRVVLTSAPHRVAARALYRKLKFEAAETTVFARKLK